MKFQWTLIFALIFALIIAVFAVFNVESVPVNYVFGTQELPLILVILSGTLLGGLVIGLFGMIRQYRLQHKIKQLSKELEQSKAEQEQNQAALQQSKAELEQSQAALQQSKAELEQSQAALQQSKTELEQYRAQLDKVAEKQAEADPLESVEDSN